MTLSETPDMLNTIPNTADRVAAGDYGGFMNMSQSVNVGNKFDRTLPKNSSRSQFSSML